MYEIGFNVVLNGALLWIANEMVSMTHCPLRGLDREAVDSMKEGEHWHGESKNKKYSMDPVTNFHLHGHTHKTKDWKELYGVQNQYDVGVRANDYKPVSISEIESWIARCNKI